MRRLVAVVAFSHPLAGREQVSPAELANRGPFIEFRRGTELRRLLDEWFQAGGHRTDHPAPPRSTEHRPNATPHTA